MAILDLLRRRREDDEDENEGGADVGVNEDDEEDLEDYAPGAGLLGRFASVPGLGWVTRREGEAEEDDGEDDEDAPDEEEETGGGLMGRLNRMRGLGGVLRRGSDGDDGDDGEDEDEDDEVLLPAATSADPELPSQGAVARVRTFETAEEYLITGPGEQSPVEEVKSKSGPDAPLAEDEDEEEPASGVEQAVEEKEEVTEQRPETGHRLRELALSQEDIPAEELAHELHRLLNHLNRRR